MVWFGLVGLVGGGSGFAAKHKRPLSLCFPWRPSLLALLLYNKYEKELGKKLQEGEPKELPVSHLIVLLLFFSRAASLASDVGP